MVSLITREYEHFGSGVRTEEGNFALFPKAMDRSFPNGNKSTFYPSISAHFEANIPKQERDGEKCRPGVAPNTFLSFELSRWCGGR
jgi:hypothetical protein